jgi:hypothetical protein
MAIDIVGECSDRRISELRVFFQAYPEHSAKGIPADVRANDKLWKKMPALLAGQAAVFTIRREVASSL